MTGTTESTKNRHYGEKVLHDSQNHGNAVATGFHGDLTEQEVEKLLGETIAQIGVSTENVKIKCPSKPITYAFIYFNDNDERNK